MRCYEKNEYWASCRSVCTPGRNPNDPPEHRTPWSCRLLEGHENVPTVLTLPDQSLEDWEPTTMKMTHYWDCNGQSCDATVLSPWDENKYVSPPGYGPQDPEDFGGSKYGEKMWLTGAASDVLSNLMGEDDPCCGSNRVGGCGRCLLIQNPHALQNNWTVLVMKKNRCPPSSAGCASNKPHFDIAAPGFDNLRWSTANVCGIREGTGFTSQMQSEALGNWWDRCPNTAECKHLCDALPRAFQRGCKLFASWGWTRGDPADVKFKAVECPSAFKAHISSLFGSNGVGETP